MSVLMGSWNCATKQSVGPSFEDGLFQRMHRFGTESPSHGNPGCLLESRNCTPRLRTHDPVSLDDAIPELSQRHLRGSDACPHRNWRRDGACVRDETLVILG